MNHFMLDLETLGSNPCAPIVQIACVRFTPDGPTSDQFNSRVNLQIDDAFYKFKADVATIEWWLEQSDVIRARVFSPNGRESLRTALDRFGAWLGTFPGDKKIWSHATFDPPILTTAHSALGVTLPVRHSQFLDIRTINFLAGKVSDFPARETCGPHHDALADCKYQAGYTAAMMRKLGIK